MSAELCSGHTAVCVVRPARAYRVWPANTPVVVLCDPCATRLGEMGLGLEEALPEWRRRLTARDNTGSILTGARR